MRLRRLAIPLSILVIVFCAVLLWPSDEKRLKRLFKECAHAIESEHPDAVMSGVSLTYRDDLGLTYLSLRPTLQRMFATLSEITIDYELHDLIVTGHTARAVVSARVVATSGHETGYVLGDIKAPHSLTIILAKESGSWLVVRCGRCHPGRSSLMVTPSQGYHPGEGVSPDSERGVR